jgi:hypothetical protein
MSFAHLNLSKESQRGIKTIATLASNATRLVLFMSQTPRAFIDQWPVMISVCVASAIGSFIGSRMWSIVNTETIIRMLYLLLMLTACPLVGDIANTVNIAVFCGAFAAYMLAIFLCRPSTAAQSVSEGDDSDGASSSSSKAKHSSILSTDVDFTRMVTIEPSSQYHHDSLLEDDRTVSLSLQSYRPRAQSTE